MDPSGLEGLDTAVRQQLERVLKTAGNPDNGLIMNQLSTNRPSGTLNYVNPNNPNPQERADDESLRAIIYQTGNLVPGVQPVLIHGSENYGTEVFNNEKAGARMDGVELGQLINKQSDGDSRPILLASCYGGLQGQQVADTTNRVVIGSEAYVYSEIQAGGGRSPALGQMYPLNGYWTIYVPGSKTTHRLDITPPPPPQP